VKRAGAIAARRRGPNRRLSHLDSGWERAADGRAQALETRTRKREAGLRRQALVEERQRIMADLHDGLGATLIGLLRYVQSGDADNRGVERRVLEALRDLQLAVDALEPAEGDLAAVLGKLRFRLEPLLESGGMRFRWDVAELPPLDGLEPAMVFSIQRIVLEAVANALKHSGAREIRVKAGSEPCGTVKICIEEDGRGFDAARPAPGLGLASMRARAERIGARLRIVSQEGRGTAIHLTIPAPGPAFGDNTVASG